MSGSARIPAACALLLAACATPPPPVETGQLFLWEIARPDGRGGIAHVMGSVHLSDAAIHFDPAVEASLAGADTLVLEVDPGELDPARMAQLTAETGFFADGRTLQGVLSPETWERLEERLEDYELPREPFRTMEPWLVGMTLQILHFERRGYEADHGVDMAIARSAEAEGKAIAGLETAEAQLAALDSLPLATQELMLRELLEGAERSEEGLELMLDAWRKGDAARIEAEVFAGLGREPALDAFFEALYFERNRRMARGIAEIVDGGGVAFVVVGAGHVVGARGVPALLEEAGFSVRRLPKTARRERRGFRAGPRSARRRLAARALRALVQPVAAARLRRKAWTSKKSAGSRSASSPARARARRSRRA